MDTYLIVYDQERLAEFRRALRKGRRVTNWSGPSTMKPGDRVLFYFTQPASSIQAVGKVDGAPEPDPDSGSNWYFVNFSEVEWLRQPLPLPLRGPASVLRWWAGKPFRSSRKIPEDIAQLLLGKVAERKHQLASVGSDAAGSSRRRPASAPGLVRFAEGDTKEITRELKSRNPRLRREATRQYGTKCMVSGFDFGEVYGPQGEGFIELHHLRLLSRRAAGATDIKQVIVVCANCHRMLHRQAGEPMDWKVLQKRVRARRRHAR